MSRNQNRQGGFVLVWMAIMLSTLLGVSALAVEWNNWNRVGAQMQKAADAAALAGVVYWASNPALAENVVDEIADANGFSAEDGDTIEVWAGERPGIMGVTITRKVNNVLGTIFGITGRTLERTATAEFSAPLEMGSPEATFGTDPDEVLVDPGANPNFWASIGGPVQGKNAGEPYMTTWCQHPFFGIHVDNCLPGPVGGENLDHDPRGYFYEIRVEDATQPLHVEVYDPAQIPVGCNANNPGAFPGQVDAEGNSLWPNYGNPPIVGNYIPPSGPLNIPLSGVGPAPGVSGTAYRDFVRLFSPGYELPPGVPAETWRWGSALNVAAGLPAAAIPGYPAGVAPSVRYAPGGDNPFCSGDQFFANPYPPNNRWAPEGWGPDQFFPGPVLLPTATYRLWRANDGSLDPMAGTVVCEAEFDGYRGHIPNALVRPEVTSLANSAQMNNPAWNGNVPVQFAEYYRNWYPICGDSGLIAEEGKYFLQVTTAERLDGSEAPRAAGHNRYSVRAGIGSPTNDVGVSLAGYGRMQTAMLNAGSTGEYYLTRLEATGTNRTLTLRFWDIGDAGNNAEGTLTVVPPSDATGLNLGPPGTCHYSDPIAQFTFVSPPQTREMLPAGPNCSISDVSIDPFDAKWILVTVPIPDTYECGSGPLDCWFKLRFEWPAGIGDTAVWEASIDGDPVRLVG